MVYPGVRVRPPGVEEGSGHALVPHQLVVPAHGLPPGNTGKIQFPASPAVHHHNMIVSSHESIGADDHPSVLSHLLETTQLGDTFTDDFVTNVKHRVYRQQQTESWRVEYKSVDVLVH